MSSTLQQELGADAATAMPELGTTGMMNLSPEQLRQALLVNSRSLVEDLYCAARRQIEDESTRLSRLESKATTLLTAVGLSLTVLFTFGGQTLLNERNPLQYLDRAGVYTLVIAFMLSVVCALGASICAIVALKVIDDYRTVNERDIFNEKVLLEADEYENDDDAITFYRRYITIQLWGIAQHHFHLNHQKALWVRRGQILFFIFIWMLVFLGGSVIGRLVVKF